MAKIDDKNEYHSLFLNFTILSMHRSVFKSGLMGKQDIDCSKEAVESFTDCDLGGCFTLLQFLPLKMRIIVSAL